MTPASRRTLRGFTPPVVARPGSYSMVIGETEVTCITCEGTGVFRISRRLAEMCPSCGGHGRTAPEHAVLPSLVSAWRKDFLSDIELQGAVVAQTLSGLDPIGQWPHAWESLPETIRRQVVSACEAARKAAE